MDERLLQMLAIGLSLGAIYTIIALGYSVVYKATRVVNFAHCQYLMVGGLVAAWLNRDLGVGLLWAVGAGVGAGMILGAITEIVAVRLLKQKDPLTITVGTVVIGLIVEALALQATAGSTYSMKTPWPSLSFSIAGVAFSGQTFWNLAIAVALTIGLSEFFRHTRRGIGLQAAADNHETAALYGVSRTTTTLSVFLIAGLLGGVGGVAMVPVTLMTSSLGLVFGLKGFAAATLGGLGSIPGALVGGLLIGLMEAFFAVYVSAALSSIVAFCVMLAVLLWRPTGLFREVAVERV
ncbi:MAG TPA: branched-chain amino acid ABC transporter permease [Rhodoblastus sp.]|nr:branched-chain amino acid ABC transporter permease [Rhodoblastus sp.]